MPLLSREKPDLEVRVEELKDKLRWERARLSDFELEERENTRLKREREKRALDEDLDGGQVSNEVFCIRSSCHMLKDCLFAVLY